MLQRRSFVTASIAFVHAAIGLPLAAAGLRMLLAPLKPKRRAPSFLRVAPLAGIAKERPVRVDVLADRWDAYTHHPPGPIGQVWLLRVGVDDPPRVRCWQSICPHLGCGIAYSQDRRAFRCPCHNAAFDLDGRVQSGPAPRGMDELACRVSEPDDEGRRWVEVEFERFQTGKPNRKPMA